MNEELFEKIAEEAYVDEMEKIALKDIRDLSSRPEAVSDRLSAGAMNAKLKASIYGAGALGLGAGTAAVVRAALVSGTPEKVMTTMNKSFKVQTVGGAIALAALAGDSFYDIFLRKKKLKKHLNNMGYDTSNDENVETLLSRDIALRIADPEINTASRKNFFNKLLNRDK